MSGNNALPHRSPTFRLGQRCKAIGPALRIGKQRPVFHPDVIPRGHRSIGPHETSRDLQAVHRNRRVTAIMSRLLFCRLLSMSCSPNPCQMIPNPKINISHHDKIFLRSFNKPEKLSRSVGSRNAATSQLNTSAKAMTIVTAVSISTPARCRTPSSADPATLWTR